MIRTQIQVEKNQMKWLKAYALGKGISMSQLVRESIDFYRTPVKSIPEVNIITIELSAIIKNVQRFTSHKTLVPRYYSNGKITTVTIRNILNVSYV